MLTRMSDIEGSANDGFVRAINAELGARKMTQRQLADQVGAHFTTMNGYLTGSYAKRTPTPIDVLDAIASELGMDIVELAVKAKARRAEALVAAQTNVSSRRIDAALPESEPRSSVDRRTRVKARNELAKLMAEANQLGEDGEHGGAASRST